MIVSIASNAGAGEIQWYQRSDCRYRWSSAVDEAMMQEMATLYGHTIWTLFVVDSIQVRMP